MCVNMKIVQMLLNALRIHIKIIYVKIFVCEISLRLRDFLCSLRWIPIYSVTEDNMTSTSCLYFSRIIVAIYHQILTKHTVLCFHCLCVINSFDPYKHSLQCLFQPPKDWGGENVTVVPSCYRVMEIAHLKFQGPPSLLFPGFLLATLQVQIQSVTGTHFSRKGKKLFWKLH